MPTAHAQTSSNAPTSASQPFWAAMTAEELVVAPSPEVGTMPELKSAEVDMSTGTATLAIPLGGWSVGSTPVSIGLSYRIGAFKTEEEAGWIGLGWNLQGGGAVTRSFVGQPDESVDFDLRKGVITDVDYFDRLLRYRTDANLDRYSYHCPGGSGQFVIYGGNIIQLGKSNDKIEFMGELTDGVRDFRIITPDGTSYEFSERETCEYRYLAVDTYGNPGYTAVSTWHLKRIVLPEGADTIQYEYDNSIRYSRIHSRYTQTLTLRYDPYDERRLYYLKSGPGESSTHSTTIEYLPTISRIYSRTGSAIFSYDTSDRNKKFIKSITIKDCDNKNVRIILLKGNQEVSRRKLNEITVTDGDGETIDHMEFTYYDDSGNRVGDYFGYTNSLSQSPIVTDMSTLLDHNTLDPNPRRKPDFTHATAGALKSFLSATGVVTEYQYEPNTITYRRPSPRISYALTSDTLVTSFPSTPQIPDTIYNPIPDKEETDSTVTIGIRLKSIKLTDRISGRNLTRAFTYSGGLCNIDFNKLSISDFISISGLQWFYQAGTILLVTVNDTSSTLLYGSRSPGYRFENASIFYGNVTETISGTALDQAIKTDYEFDLSRCPLTYVGGGREMDNIQHFDNTRSLYVGGGAVGATEVQLRRFGSHVVRGYFREHIGGATPELKRRTVYRMKDGQYTPALSEELFYRTVDSSCVVTGLHYELLVRLVRKFPQEALVNALRSANDISYFNLDVESSVRVVDSIATMQYFPDGSTRLRTSRLHYTDFRPQIRPGGHVIFPADQLTDPSNDFALLPDETLEADSIYISGKLLLPIGETVREGGHTMQRRAEVSSMVSKGFFADATARGLQTLPIRETWVMNGCDTLRRSYSYGRFPAAGGLMVTRPYSITTAINGSVSETLSIGEYSLFGRPLSVGRTGQPAMLYTWGYGDDLPTSISVADAMVKPGKQLTTKYEYAPGIGCTRIISPSGRNQSFTYIGSRLNNVYDSEGHRLLSHVYELHSMTPGQFAGRNVIATLSFLSDNDFSVNLKHFDGFGCQVAQVSEGAGADGGDVASVTHYDALGRPIASWVPLPLSADQLSDAMKRDTPLQSAALAEFADATAFSAMTYPPGEASDRPQTATIAGSDFEAHPSRSELTCSNPADEHRRVMRFRWDGSRLSADGFYAAGELSAVRSEDGDGRVTYIFTDCLGRTVLQRSLADDDRLADTYTIADPWGNPLLVIPPEASEQLGCFGEISMTDSFVDNLIDQYCYVYRYDSRLRLRSKKIPGCSPVEFAYDVDSRLAFTRDGNQAMEGRRSFVLYDPLGRTAVTGTCRDALSDLIWTADNSAIPPMTATAASGLPFASTFCGSGYQVSSEMAADLAEASLLTSTFYDDYTFIPADRSAQFLSAAGSASAISSPKGLATGSLTAVLGPSWLADTIPPLLAATFYDREERPVLTISDTHRGETLLTATTYNLASQPLSVRSSILAPDGSETAIVCHTTYDSHGRPVTSSLDYNDQSFNLGRSAYDRLGRLSAVTSEGDITRTSSYDLHGWLSSWQSPGLSQQLLYASGPQANHTGRISSKLTTIDSDLRRYDYTYDRLGRLSAARFSSSTTPEADFSTAYDYDLQGNILQLNRRGLIAPGLYDEIDRISASYHGNQLIGLSEGAPTVLLENSLDMPQGHWPSGFYYDRNGNQVSDPSRGIFAIYYNPLNLPTGITMNSGARFDYLYSAAGTKLAEIIYEPGESGTPAIRRDYAGIFEYENSSLARISLSSGYITPLDLKQPFPGVLSDADETSSTMAILRPLKTNATYHIYAFDHQGNVIGVYNTKTATLEQTTDYYPYGLPHATATYHSDCNRRLYSAKELTSEAGLNTYDFAARWQSPALPIFTTPDPLAEQTQSIGVYVFCGGDPINRIDPTGMIFKNEKDRTLLLNELNKRKSHLQQEIDNINKNGEHDSDGKLLPKAQTKLNELKMQMTHIDQAISDVNLLADDPDHEYSLSQDDDYIDHKVISHDGKSVFIQYSKLALAYHEISHVRQSLKSKAGLRFYNGELLSASRHNQFKIVIDEVEAYRIQYSFDSRSMPAYVGNINDINIIYLRNRLTPNKTSAYPAAWRVPEEPIVSYQDLFHYK
ncbi:MAG: hypothetical protein HDS21_00335 [Bacteroides sp.]|nr:hypothetical protein [Bacteroides sp.]